MWPLEKIDLLATLACSESATPTRKPMDEMLAALAAILA
jgi:hypothetical protein